MELAILSGKGGTGKTTIATALSELANSSVRVDCDVDAPNFYLYFNGKDIKKENFYGGKKAVLNKKECIQCGKCKLICRFDAIHQQEINPLTCEGCGACTLICPKNAITLSNEKAADAFITQIDEGIISRAKMEIGSDGSGKLITLLRKNGKPYSEKDSLTVIDASPGIGCPVISSITGCDSALIVTEPTQSGLKDLKRVVKLCQHFKIFSMICINKYDINKKMTSAIEEYARKEGLKIIGKIPYDDTVIQSINELTPIINYDNSEAKTAIINMWQQLNETIKYNTMIEEEEK